MDTFDFADWPVLLPADPSERYSYSEYTGLYSVIDGAKVDDITRDRIARVDASHVEDGDWSETDLAVLVELTDGTWAACMAWCDTTGWDCRSGVEWKWAPTRELVIEQGLDRGARQKLGLALPQDADGSEAR